MEESHNRRLEDVDLDSPGATIDHKARQMVRRVADWVDSHERLCTERWEQSRAASKDLKDALSSFSASQATQFRWLMGMILTALGTSIAILATRLFEHIK